MRGIHPINGPPEQRPQHYGGLKGIHRHVEPQPRFQPSVAESSRPAACEQHFNMFIYKSGREVRVGISFERDPENSSSQPTGGALVRALHPFGIAVRARPSSSCAVVSPDAHPRALRRQPPGCRWATG